MYNLCMYYEKQKSCDETELTFQPTLVEIQKLLSLEQPMYRRNLRIQPYSTALLEKKT